MLSCALAAFDCVDAHLRWWRLASTHRSHGKEPLSILLRWPVGTGEILGPSIWNGIIIALIQRHTEWAAAGAFAMEFSGSFSCLCLGPQAQLRRAPPRVYG